MSRTATVHRLVTTHTGAVDETGDKQARAFRAAQRHSWRVRLLRRALPAAAIGGFVLLLLGTWLDPLRLYRKLPVEFSRITISGNKLTMEAPKLTGFTRDKRPYVVTADSAAQDLTKPDLVELTNINGQVEQADRGMTELRAKSGLYDMKAEHIHVFDGVEIRASGGYRANLREAFFEVRKGHIVSKDPVDVVFPEGNLQASRLEIFDHGAKAVFDGGVTMTVKLSKPAKAATTEAKK
jgi:lipopolysaccharide export system protein LptC